MTTPNRYNYDSPIPDTYRSHNPAREGCTFPGCGTQDTATVDGVHGRRCAPHPPTYSREHLLALGTDGLGVKAYLRTVYAYRLHGGAR